MHIPLTTPPKAEVAPDAPPDDGRKLASERYRAIQSRLASLGSSLEEGMESSEDEHSGTDSEYEQVLSLIESKQPKTVKTIKAGKTVKKTAPAAAKNPPEVIRETVDGPARSPDPMETATIQQQKLALYRFEGCY